MKRYFQIKSEWCECEEERSVVYEYQYTDSLKNIHGQAINVDLPIVPIERFEPEMIEGILLGRNKRK